MRILNAKTIMLGVTLLAGFLWMGVYTSEDKPAAVVEMTNRLAFTPDTVRIKVGETVLWKNTSLLVHSVTADPELETKKSSVSLPSNAASFNSGMMDPEQTFKHTFRVPGTYNYFCIPHEAMMTGVVIVEPK